MATAPQTAQSKASDDVCAAKHWFGSKSTPPCKVCDACKEEQKDQCTLHPAYKPNCCGKKGKTPHHLVPVHCTMPPGQRGEKSPQMYQGCEKYNEDLAPCICVTGHGKNDGDHELLHLDFDPKEDSHKSGKKASIWTYGQCRDDAAKSAHDVIGCDEGCIKAQLDEYHKEQAGMTDSTQLRADSRGKGGKPNIPLGNISVSTADT